MSNALTNRILKKSPQNIFLPQNCIALWCQINLRKAILFISPTVQKSLFFSSVQSLSCVWLFVTPWTAACQDSLSITNSWSPLKPMSIESVMSSNCLILCRPLLLPPSIFSSIRVFSNESALHIRWPKYWSFNFNISPPMNTQDWFPLWWTGWTCSPRDSQESSLTSQLKSINSSVLNFLYSLTLTSIHDYWKLMAK